MLSTITTTIITGKEDHIKYNESGSVTLTCFFMKKTDYLYGEKQDKPKALSIPAYLTIIPSKDDDDSLKDEFLMPETWLTISGNLIPHNDYIEIECFLNPVTGHHIRKVDPTKGGANLISLFGTTKKADPYVNEQQTVTRFTLRVNKNKEEAYWLKCNAFNKTAKNLGSFVKGGDQLAVQGTLSINTYMDKNGEKRREPEMMVNGFSLVYKNEDKSSSSSASATEPTNYPDNEMSDIPF